MCDYSLEAVRSRPATVGEKVVLSTFRNTISRGFASPADPGMAVCLIPGQSAVVFDKPPRVNKSAVLGTPPTELGTVEMSQMASFIQVDLRHPFKHHDALRFADGSIVKVSTLPIGLEATVIAVTEGAVKKLLADAAAAVAKTLPEGGLDITREHEHV